MRSGLEMSETASWVSCAVRSCDAVASVMVFSVKEDGGERRQKEVMGALCNRALDDMLLE